MAKRICWYRLMPLAALGLAGMLGGCVADPASHAGSADGYSTPYRSGGYVGFSGGLHEGVGHDGGWR